MIEIIIFGILCYFVWKRKEKIEASDSLAVRKLFYLPTTQFLCCSVLCLISFLVEGDIPQDEINQFINENNYVNDLSVSLIGIDFTQDQLTMLLLTEKLHQQARYILIGSFIILFIQIYSTYKTQFNELIIEGIAIIHSLLILYIGNILGDVLSLMVNQSGTMKIINAINEDSSLELLGLVVIWLLPFHYLYHFTIKKQYTINRTTN